MPLDTEARRKYQAKYRAKKGGQKSYHKKWAAKNQEKVKQHNRVNAGPKSSKPKTCSKCGSKTNVQVHHKSYNPPRTQALCARCHAKTKPNTKNKSSSRVTKKSK